jgi:hypothetical protein
LPQPSRRASKAAGEEPLNEPPPDQPSVLSSIFDPIGDFEFHEQDVGGGG